MMSASDNRWFILSCNFSLLLSLSLSKNISSPLSIDNSKCAVNLLNLMILLTPSQASSPLGVIASALAGYGGATLLVVLVGSLLGTFLSEKLIAYIGGTFFLMFAAMTLIEIVN